MSCTGSFLRLRVYSMMTMKTIGCWLLSLLFLSSLITFALAMEEEEEEENVFHLPYSETEDVDFSIVRPTGTGCYQWSTNDTERVRLVPLFVDYERMCGFKLDLQIVRAEANSVSSFNVAITAENVDLTSDGPMVVEYVVHVRPLVRLEVLGLKTQLEVGDEAAPFAVAGYDEDENEFDTLDGLQISWFIGSHREVARFERQVQRGSVVRVIGEHSGEAAVFAVVTDPNYTNDIEPAFAEIEVSSSISIEPDGVYLIEGGDVNFRVLDKGIDFNDNVELQVMDLSLENSEYHLDVRDPDILRLLDNRSGNATALKKGETMLYLKNREDEVLKSTPVRVTEVSEASIVLYPVKEEKEEKRKEESDVLTAHKVYDLEVRMFNPSGRRIHPSENILCKLSMATSISMLSMAPSGLSARIRTSVPGLARVRASLRSVLLTETDEELEIQPHIKATRDLEVYEKVVIRPKEIVLPFDMNLKKNYELKFKATGAGKHYTFSVVGTNVSEAAHIDNEGWLTTHGTKDDFIVRASMPRSLDNFDDAKVYQRLVEGLSFRRGQMKEVIVDQPFVLFLAMVTSLEGEERMFSDCTDVPYEINIDEKGEKNFGVEDKERRGQAVLHNSCTGFTIRSKKPGQTANIIVSYKEPMTKTTVEDSIFVISYRGLRAVWPKEDRRQKPHPEQLVLPIGSKANVVLQGGPGPWPLYPQGHTRQLEVDDDEIVRVRLLEDLSPITETYVDTHVIEVTCLALGDTSFLYVVGNKNSETLKDPARSAMEVRVRCAEPRRLILNAVPRKRTDFDTDSKYFMDPTTSNILVPSDRDVLVQLTVKDGEGKTFHDVSSLKFNFESSNNLLTKTKDHIEVPGTNKLVNVVNSPNINSKPFQSFSPLSTGTGAVAITATITGYDSKVLQENDIENQPEGFSVSESGEKPEDDDDDDWDEEHSDGLQDSLHLELRSSVDINKLIRRNSTP